MNLNLPNSKIQSASWFAILVVSIVPQIAFGQAAANNDHSGHTGAAADPKKALAEQLHRLQTRVSQLEARLKQKHSGKMMDMKSGSMKQMGSMSKMGTGEMKMMGGKMGMGMMGKGMSGMGMSMGGMKMMGKGMAMMGKMKGMEEMQMPSALPGFPGASHIYHIGATGFFLDHPQHITLTTKQQTRLNGIKEQSLLKQGTFDRKIEEAEQRVWTLTSSDSPDAMKIEKAVREIEKMTAEKRIAFIRSVGEGAKVLAEDQRKILVGTMPPDQNNEQHQAH